jgi:hypothetical protein
MRLSVRNGSLLTVEGCVYLSVVLGLIVQSHIWSELFRRWAIGK